MTKENQIAIRALAIRKLHGATKGESKSLIQYLRAMAKGEKSYDLT